MDVSKIDSVKQGIASLPASFKAIDILINNAGLALGVNKAHVNIPAEIDVVVDVNVKGVLYLIQEITPGMVTRGRGHIINISSIAGHEAYPGGSVYCATKYALRGMTLSLAAEFRGSSVHFVHIALGSTLTEFGPMTLKEKEERNLQGKSYFTPQWVAKKFVSILEKEQFDPEITIYTSDYDNER